MDVFDLFLIILSSFSVLGILAIVIILLHSFFSDLTTDTSYRRYYRYKAKSVIAAREGDAFNQLKYLKKMLKKQCWRSTTASSIFEQQRDVLLMKERDSEEPDLRFLWRITDNPDLFSEDEIEWIAEINQMAEDKFSHFWKRFKFPKPQLTKQPPKRTHYIRKVGRNRYNHTVVISHTNN